MDAKLQLLLLPLLILLLLPLPLPQVSAQEINTSASCDGDKLLLVNMSWRNYVNDTLVNTVTKEFPVYCDYGCHEGACDPAPFNQILWVIGFLIVILIIGYIVTRFI